ncbi:MAG: PEP-CTERM sorting domain-containing protein [Capsulimonas sp.]|uniref:PEP-CTERM sorting domain-containing protein n=1 Tax=Capsulimonas sp. TaxID=2494211 RepID=UPI0032634C22
MKFLRFAPAAAFVAGAFFFLTVTPAQAAPFSFTVSGVITSDSDLAAFGGAHIGDVFTSTFTLNTSMPFTASGGYREYESFSSLDGATVTFSGFTVTPDALLPQDQYLLARNEINAGGVFVDPHDAIFTQSSNASGSGLTDAYSSIDLSSAPGHDPLFATTLPLTGPGLNDISQWDVHNFTFYATNASNNQVGYFTGDITAISSAAPAVPEPSQSAAIVLGVVCLAVCAVRRRRRAQPIA